MITCEGLTRGRRTFTPGPSPTAAQCSAVSARPVWSSAPRAYRCSPDPNPTRCARRSTIFAGAQAIKIEEAVCCRRRSSEGARSPDGTGRVGEKLARGRARQAVGTAEYADDMRLPGMLYGGAVRSEYPRALVNSIDVTEAIQPPASKRITAAALPGKHKVGHLKRDQWVLIPVGGEVHFRGDPIVLIAAETVEALEEAQARKD